MKIHLFILIFVMLFSTGCSKKPESKLKAEKKIEIDLSALDSEGLRGDETGKVSVSYEFCIPDKPEFREQVVKIDSSVVFMPGSKGRIKAGDGECLCVGNTHQPEFQKVLNQLAELPYINRIIECHFE